MTTIDTFALGCYATLLTGVSLGVGLIWGYKIGQWDRQPAAPLAQPASAVDQQTINLSCGDCNTPLISASWFCVVENRQTASRSIASMSGLTCTKPGCPGNVREIITREVDKFYVARRRSSKASEN